MDAPSDVAAMSYTLLLNLDTKEWHQKGNRKYFTLVCVCVCGVSVYAHMSIHIQVDRDQRSTMGFVLQLSTVF